MPKISKKAEALEHWRSLPEGLDPLPHFRPIPYKAEGSTYGACGVRIDGNPAFIDAVLSRLKPLLAGENCVTRLGLSRRPVETVEVAGEVKGFTNRDKDAEVCYIRLHVRGREGGMMAAFAGTPEFGSTREQIAAATKQFALSLGVDPEA
jgi:hypothetical protein